MSLRPLACWAVLLAVSAPAGARTHEDKLTKEREHYAEQTEPVGRAKALVKLGRAEFSAARKDADSGNASGALQLVEEYDQEANATHKALLGTHVNPVNHSKGFRQLQISVRESSREVREIIQRVPFQDQQAFETVRDDLDSLNHQLISELFPRPSNPGKQEKKKRGD